MNYKDNYTKYKQKGANKPAFLMLDLFASL